MQFARASKLASFGDGVARNPKVRSPSVVVTFLWLSILSAFFCSCTQQSKTVSSAVAPEPRQSAPAQASSPPSSSSSEFRTRNQPRHVFLIILENKSFATTFGANSPAPYLSRELRSQGQLLTHYYGIGHNSLDNYIAMVSGQEPNPDTQKDCPKFETFKHYRGLDSNGQATGSGCVYPKDVVTIANQLEAKHLTWGGYMEDMGNALPLQPATCRHPAIGHADCTFLARPGDQYAARHNPFVYFRSIVENQQDCDEHDLPLDRLITDLKTVEATPNFVFITPNLCDDGHDPEQYEVHGATHLIKPFCPGFHYPEHDNTCVDGAPGGLLSIDTFLRQWVPPILSSPAYKQDGMLIITFDEASIRGPDADSSACCQEPAGPYTRKPGGDGPGGGRIGALIISPFVKPGSVNDHPYNHYALLRSIEDLFNLEYLGFAKQRGLEGFGEDVYNQPHP